MSALDELKKLYAKPVEERTAIEDAIRFSNVSNNTQAEAAAELATLRADNFGSETGGRMKRHTPLTRYLKKSKHLDGCKKRDKAAKKCDCGLYQAVDEYIMLLKIQELHFERMRKEIMEAE